MKSVSSGLAAHLGERLTTLATCWRVARRDGMLFGFTDHDRDLVVDGLTYRARTGYRRAAIASRGDLSVDDTDVEGILDAAEIDAASLRAGLWDGAEVRIFLVNWSDLTQGPLRLRKGRLGEVIARDDGTFRAELRGLAQALNVTVGELYTPECRADLGDARCRVPLRAPFRQNSTAYALGEFVRVETDPLATGSYREQERIYECTTAGTSASTPPVFNTAIGATTADGSVVWTTRMAWTLPATVEAAPDLSTVIIQNTGTAPTQPGGWFEHGVAIFETGLNAGVARDVLAWTQATRTLALFLPLPFPAVAGDVLRVQPGCDKRLATCRDKFANLLNFRGEPHIPGDKGIIGVGV
ncbi:DUF2163 domain-containing protein [Elioraea sp.]|uniref:DUF2163 domain-containing protein n=1 Tax=Elioraea sp. TaxID=2185103 RepID=UPI003F7306F3